MATLTRTTLGSYDLKDRIGKQITNNYRRNEHVKHFFRPACRNMAIYAITLSSDDDSGCLFILRFKTRTKNYGEKKTNGTKICSCFI